MLPLLAAVPAVIMGAAGLVGGAASLAGGAMSLAGGVMAAGSTMAGIAADAAGGVIGAATSLTGGGKGAPVEEREPADQSTSDEQGAKALPPGVKLNKNGIMIQDKGGPRGGQILPGQFDEDGQLKSMDERLGSVTADRSGATPVNQILDYVKVIAANTARTAMGIGALMQQSVSSPSQIAQDNINEEKDPPQKKQGMVSKVFGGIRDRMKKINESLGGVAKFMLKGLGLAGLLFLFKRNEEAITKAVGSVFKFFHDMYKTMQDSDDPLGDLMKFLKEKFKTLGEAMMRAFEETALPLLEKMFTMVVDYAKSFFLGDSQKLMTEYSGDLVSSGNTLTNLQTQLKDSGGSGDLGFIGRKGITGVETSGGQKMDEAMRGKVTRAAKKRWKALYEYSRESDYAVQWTGLPFMRDGMTGWKWLTPSTDALNQRNNIAIDAVMKTQPIINGTIRPTSYLTNPNFVLDKELGISEGMDEIDIQGIRDNAEEATMLRWKNQNLNTLFSVGGIGLTTEQHGAPGFNLMPLTKSATDTKILELQKHSADVYGAILPDPDLQDSLAEAALHDSANGSIFTHDNTSHRLLKPISEAFEKGNGPVIIDNSSNNNSVTKQGDNIQMPLDVHHSDPTARAFHEWKYA